MDIKSDKTFEDIVERIVQLFKPQLEKRNDAAAAHAPSIDIDATSSAATPPSQEDETA